MLAQREARVFDELSKRDCLVSWVHFSLQGNRILAAAVGDEILTVLRSPN